MRERCIAPYTAKMAMGHVASSAPGASQMYMSVPIGSWGSYDPVITLKPLWGSPGTELSTWSIGSLCCIRAIQRSRIASRPLRSYTAIQRYTALYTIQLYIAIHYTGYTTPLWTGTALVNRHTVESTAQNGHANYAPHLPSRLAQRAQIGGEEVAEAAALRRRGRLVLTARARPTVEPQPQ